jgi:hypothetical protein
MTQVSSADDNVTVSVIDIVTRQEDSGQRLTCRAQTPGLPDIKADAILLDIHCKFPSPRYNFSLHVF